jgi:hypothetical protein
MSEEKDNIKGFTSNPTSINPEERSVSWDITYKANFGLVYKMFKNLYKEYKKFIYQSNLDAEKAGKPYDDKLKEIGNEINYLWNQFRSHLRKEYPTQYSKLQAIEEAELKEFIHKQLEEMSATGAGESSGHFEPGTGAQYATPKAFNPNKKAKGAKNIYYYKLGWKKVPTEELHNQSKTLDHKDLWKKKLTEDDGTQSYVNSLNLQDQSLKNFIGNKIGEFDQIEDKLNTLLPLLKQAKSKTMEHYKESPDFNIQYGTDLAVDYLDKMITLFRDKKD